MIKVNEKELNIISLVEERSDLLTQVLNTTESTKLNKDTTEKYIEMMEIRKNLFKRIYEIDDILKDERLDELISFGSAEFKRKTEEVFNKARATAYRIKEVDLENVKVTAQIKEQFMAGFKTVNEGRSIRNVYVDNNKSYDAHYFDKTK